MKVNIGEKIKELRRRDGKTQEALANAVGVTSQSVSRWENNIGYPDMELIPLIASYFHISIDELFSYDNDRNARIEKLLDEAEEYRSKDKYSECVSILRMANAEFPSEIKIMYRLADALYNMGCIGPHGTALRIEEKDGNRYVTDDVKYNNRNETLREAALLFENVYSNARIDELTSNERMFTIRRLVDIYSKMGKYDRAKELVGKLYPMSFSREYMLAEAASGEEKLTYLSMALVETMANLCDVISTVANYDRTIWDSPIAKEKLVAMAKLYEAIFDDGECGSQHLRLHDLYHWASQLAARDGDYDAALEYFEKCYSHCEKWNSLCQTGTHSFTALFVRRATYETDFWHKQGDFPWQLFQFAAPEEFYQIVKADPRFAKCFENLKEPVYSKRELIKAHDASKNHKPELEVRQKCGCFYCLKIFDSSEIKRWLTHDNPADRRGTALCPYCGVDSVIGEKSGYRITSEFLAAMHKEWFEN